MKPQDKRQIIHLARSGSPERAWSLLSELAGDQEDDPDVLVLKGRLTKDRAKRAGANSARGSEAAALFAESADLYELAARGGNISYPLINAASLALLAGQSRRSQKLAAHVLEMIDAYPGEAETPYWHSATQAEALLLLGKEVEARAAMTRAMQRAPQAWEDHAATIGQMQLLCRELDLSSDWLDRLRPPRSLHFAGIIGIDPQDETLPARVAEWLERENIGFGWGALAAGADIVIAEALLARGAQLNIVLPCPVEQFRAHSVEAADIVWTPRFDHILQHCETLEVLESSAAPDPASVNLAEGFASGLALQNAKNLQSEAVALRVVSAGKKGENLERAGLRTMALPAQELADSTPTKVPAQSDFKVALCIAGTVGSPPPYLFNSLAEAWASARSKLSSGKGAALDYAYLSADDLPNAAFQDRLAQLAALAETGTVMASRAIGFALLADEPTMHVENHGDLRDAQGLIPICSIR